MNETERRRLWHEAAAALHVSTSEHPDWPERLALSLIAALHNQATPAGMLNFLQSEADAGRLPTEEHAFQRVARGRRVIPSRYLTGSFRAFESPPPTVTTHVTRSASAADVAALLGASNVGPWLAAWIGPHRSQLTPHQDETAAPAKPKRETQADRVARWLKDCEQRALTHGEPFDRAAMPGIKAEFLDLLHALDAELRSIETVDSLDRYLSKTGCKWPLSAGKQPSAAPLYARLFPEARIRAPGAVSPQRRKA